MNLRAINVFGLGCILCLLALPASAAPSAGKISGVVVDPSGTPQMGATVLVSSEQLLASSSVQLLTNDHGRFSTAALPAGKYSIRVTLAGFLPAMEQHIDVDGEHATLLEIVLGSMFSSFEKLRRQPDQPVATDDWTWVLRSSAATRTVLRWQDSEIALDGVQNADAASEPQARGRIEMTSGADLPGSVSGLSDSPGTAFVYDLGLGGKSQLLMAGQLSVDDSAASSTVAGEWLPTGQAGSGSVTTILLSDSRLGGHGPEFRALRMSHDDQFMLGDIVSVRYGADYLMAGLNGTTSALRPRAEVAVQLADGWQLAGTFATHPWQDTAEDEDALQSTLNTLGAFPALLVRDGGRPVLENNVHEEIALDHALSGRSDFTAAIFHDDSSHTAVIARNNGGNGDFVPDYFSQVIAYDGGPSSSMGARLVYREKFSDSLTTTVIYAYAGALAPNDAAQAGSLRGQLVTAYRQSVAGAVSATVPRFRTKVTASYKWLNGPAVSQQDSYGESLYEIDPYLSVEIRQPLPGHMEVQADVGNLLAQGYVPISTADGSFTLVPSYRYFRGGLSLQF